MNENLSRNAIIIVENNGFVMSCRSLSACVTGTRLAWQNLEAQLKAAGMTFDNLVKITTILPNFGDLAAAREGRSKVLGDRKPTSTLIVGGLADPAWKIEIEGIAVA